MPLSPGKELEAGLGYLPEGAEPTREEELAFAGTVSRPRLFFQAQGERTEEAGPERGPLGAEAEVGDTPRDAVG